MTAPSGPAPTLFEAIVRKRCVAATYNRGEVVLAPHAAFMRHGELHIAAVTVTRDGNPPREEKVGIFKVDGLGDLRAMDRDFAVSPVFDRGDERFAGEILLQVED
ncbi:hypothetical protein J7S20_04700 [Sphingomonadaceae bacterium LXI357]|uniref:WYL domain-containing protein n=2 Tax=Stakelama marina TaxID=2826939 RepID=A0A8T4ICH3_9SPHN|nr:hypothetical protein [Stakelama marina]